MSTENNVVSLEHSIVCKVEAAIVDMLSNRAGRWVAQHVVTGAAERATVPNLDILPIINDMVKNRLLEKSFETATDKFDNPYHLPIYRLSPKSW